MNSGHATTADVCCDETLVVSICVWVEDVVIVNGVVVEAGWLSEILHIGV